LQNIFDWNNIQPYINPVLIIIGSAIVGYIFQKILFFVFRKKSGHDRQMFSEVFAGSLKRVIIVVFIIVGADIAIDILPLKPETVAFLKQASLILIIFAVTVVVAELTVGFIRLYSRKTEGALSTTSIVTNLARTLFYVLGISFILNSIGISITPILTALGIGGLAVALALQDTLSNLFSGLYIIASGQLKIGDYVRLESGQEGYITDIKWRTSTLRALPNNLIVVPNSKLSNSILTNFYHPDKELGISIEMTIAFNNNLNEVERVCLDVANGVMKEVKGGVPDSTPSIRFGAFAENGVRFSVNLRASEFTDQYMIKHEFIKRITERFEKEGINFPSPSVEILMKNKEK
jgi:small-conductance mechanosensitive channel